MIMKCLIEELGIPKKHLKESCKQNRYSAIVHKSWLKSLTKHSKLIEFKQKSGQTWPSMEENMGTNWMKIFITQLNKHNSKVIPLPRIRNPKEEEPFLYPQLMQYIAHTNHVGLWKEAYKKYYASKHSKETLLNLADYNKVLREVISRIYGCPIVNTCDPSLSIDYSQQFDVHLNIMPVVCAVETSSAIFLLHIPHLEYNLNDCVTFSPAILDNSYTKSLFIVYQLLNILKDLHGRSLTLGEISLNDIFVNKDMWLYVFPQIESNIFVKDNIRVRKSTTNQNCLRVGHMMNHNLECEYCKLQAYDKVQVDKESLEELCHLWIFGQISNFTYISALNRLSGRVLGDPNCHYVFPWVTDFSSRCGKNWRDLKKSKYRLNKGDHQLDLTYNNGQSQVPHHVSDVLSPITYYVYTARRTPAAVLCKNVRSVWVPAEYPGSIQRMQEWTPDECIPEFYTDPNIFRSIHDDMEDLALPSWASGPEDFVEKHRRVLESSNVSEKLHHWIDLTFGYKLSGLAAVKARNVCLNLVDGHENLTKSGLVQLFSHPHPPRHSSSPYWSKIPPKITASTSPRQRRKHRRNSSTTVETMTNSEDERFPGEPPPAANATLSKIISRSRSSLHEDATGKPNRSPSSSRHKPNDTSEADAIYLPKDYKPDLVLEALEKRHSFFSKTFAGKGQPLSNDFEGDISRESVPDSCRSGWGAAFLMGPQEVGNGKREEMTACYYTDIICRRRIKELKVLGCLIVEIFLAKQLKSLGTNRDLSLDKRVEKCISVAKHSEAGLPPCISHIVNLLLQPDEHNRTPTHSETYPAVTDLGLPPPSAHLLLEPHLHCALPFSRHLPRTYTLLSNLKRFESIAVELDLLHDHPNSEKTKILLAESQVKTSVGELTALLDDVDPDVESEIVGIILPYVVQLMENPPTSVLAAWYFFEPVSRALGPRRTAQYMLRPLLKLYEDEPDEQRLPHLNKIARLYHHSYLLSLMVRLGLERFLDKFVVALVEAVGGYKDRQPVLVSRDGSGKAAQRASRSLVRDCEQVEESSGEESEKPSREESEKPSGEEGIFELDDEEKKKNDEDHGHFLLDSTSSVAIEDATEAEDSSPHDTDTSASFDEARRPKISETASDSLGWLSHRLGPLLTAKYLSRNLLKMLALCYVGENNLAGRRSTSEGISVAGGWVMGDEAAAKVLECLSGISGLYGEQIILCQYVPYMTEMIQLCKKRLTPNLEGGLIACLTLLKHIVPYFSDAMLMDQLQDVLLENIMHPIVRLLNSSEHAFPSGCCARNALARKYLDILYVLSIRIGTDMTKKYLVVPALQRFFMIFDRASVDEISPSQLNINFKETNDPTSSPDDAKPTPDSPESETRATPSEEGALKELREVFTPELAHAAYLPFAKLVGSDFLETSLKNHEFILSMCREFDSGSRIEVKPEDFPRSQTVSCSSSIGSNVAVIGNRIDVQQEVADDVNSDLLSLVRNRVESSTRHLRGNWLAYWEHEIGRSEKNKTLNFKQIALQTFAGHTQSVKCIYTLDNENSFLSGSRDKTVKLWSLRSQGDGSTTSNCQWTYGAHKKSILSISFVESLRLVASCDSVVHIWDPFMGANLGNLESAKNAPVNVLKSMPAPSTLVFAATTDGTIKIIDTKVMDYVREIKVSLNPSGLIRCLAVSPSGRWLAAGQSSGTITVVDTRTGLIVSNWRAHESEVLQLVAYDDDSIVSSGLDQNVSVWNAQDGKFNFQMRGTTEPVHCLCVNHNELISGTTANRIGVHSTLAPDAVFSNDKLRADTFRGLLTAMDYLPLNRLLLLGADTGNIHLLC